MNRGTVTENTVKRNDTGRQMPPSGRKSRASDPLLRAIRMAILILCALILIMGTVLIVLPMFRVKTVIVEGEGYHTEDEIIQASGIKEGDEIFAIDKQDVCNRIFDTCGNVQKISISRSFNTVRITVEEGNNLMYTEHDGRYYMLDDTFRAWAVSDCEADFAAYPEVKLPAIAGITLGTEISFVSEDVSYISELISYLDTEDVFSKLTEIDVEKKYDISYVLDDSCRITVGKIDNLAIKHQMAERILLEKGENAALWAVVDVTDLQKPTYRALTSAELLMK